MHICNGQDSGSSHAENFPIAGSDGAAISCGHDAEHDPPYRPHGLPPDTLIPPDRAQGIAQPDVSSDRRQTAANRLSPDRPFQGCPDHSEGRHPRAFLRQAKFGNQADCFSHRRSPIQTGAEELSVAACGDRSTRPALTWRQWGFEKRNPIWSPEQPVDNALFLPFRRATG